MTAPSDTRLSPYEVIADYERRSLAHVAGLPEQLDAPGLWRGVGYRIGSHRLASGFDEVVEILPLPPVTPVPGAQPWMLGVANIRGNLLPIVVFVALKSVNASGLPDTASRPWTASCCDNTCKPAASALAPDSLLARYVAIPV